MRKRVTFVLISLFFLYIVSLPAQDGETGGQALAEPAEEIVPAEEAPPEIFNRGTIPPDLLRPQRGAETIRYPRDTVIGELGQGNASEEAYRFARDLLQGALSQNRESALLAGSDVSLLEELFTNLQTIGALKYRVGGGREEPDGSTSFLFRYIGRERSLAGELYVRKEEEKENWRLDDVLLEEAKDITEKGNSYPFSFSSYERFF
jgi:hypothetical protein